MNPNQRVLVDTSVIIDLERLKLGEFGSAEIVLSAISVAELAFGLHTADPVERMARTERFHAMLAWYEVLPFDAEAASLYGALAALLREAGRNPRPRRMDLQIAATAAVHALPILTRNGRDFAGMERLVEVVEV
jgi:predicted nucleic acid-binding protein